MVLPDQTTGDHAGTPEPPVKQGIRFGCPGGHLRWMPSLPRRHRGRCRSRRRRVSDHSGGNSPGIVGGPPATTVPSPAPSAAASSTPLQSSQCGRSAHRHVDDVHPVGSVWLQHRPLRPIGGVVDAEAIPIRLSVCRPRGGVQIDRTATIVMAYSRPQPMAPGTGPWSPAARRRCRASCRRMRSDAAADYDDDRDGRDRHLGIGDSSMVSSTATNRVPRLTGGSGVDRDRPPRLVGEPRRALVQPGGEDLVGIALDVHASRASVESTWLSATIAARRVRVA